MPLERLTASGVALATLLAGTALAQGGPAAKTDPQIDAFVTKLQVRVAIHPYFRNVRMHAPERRDPFVFFIQESSRAEELEYARKVVNSYLPFLTEVGRIFEREYTKPLGLRRRAVAAGVAIAVLSSRASYLDYAKAVHAGDLHHTRAHYNPQLQLCVTYVDITAPFNSVPEERKAVMHEVVHALQHAYTPDGRMPRPVWFNEGLAEYRAASTSIVTSLETPVLDQLHLMYLADVFRDPDRHGLMAPIEDLVAADSYADVVARAARRLRAVPVLRRPKPMEALGAFYSQAAAFVDFLHVGDGGRYREGFKKYMKAVMHGQAGMQPFTEAFGAETGALQQAFFDHLAAESTRRLQTGILLPKIAGATGVSAARGTTPGAGDTPPTLPPPAALDRTALALRPDELPRRVTAAEALLVQGRFAPAAALLSGAPGDAAKRLHQRAAALSALFAELLRKNLEGRERMAPLVDGKRVGGDLVKIEEAHFTLATKGGEVRLPLTALGPTNLEVELRKAKLITTSSWQAAWLRWLGGQPASRALRSLRPVDELGRTLQEDTRGEPAAAFSPDDAALVALGDLQALEPGDAAAAATALARLRAAIGAHGRTAVFASRREGLTRLARGLAERAFSLDDPRCLGVHGAVTAKGDGVLEVRYGPGDEGLISDFVRDEARSTRSAERLDELRTKGGAITRKDKVCRIAGSGVFLWRTELSGPQRFRANVEVTGSGYFNLCICERDDGAGLRATIGGSVLVFDPSANISQRIGDQVRLVGGKKYVLEIEHDGAQVTFRIDGGNRVRLPAVGTLRRGRPGFFVHSDAALVVHDLTLVGRPWVADPVALRTQFADRMVADLWPR